MKHHRIAWAFLAIAWLATPVISPALDINLVSNNEVNEATHFFNEVAQKSKNPVIAEMARESLQQLKSIQSDSADSKGKKSKSIAEVALLPQYDHTYVVPATVNQRYLATFLIDTGASYTVITPKLAKTLGLSVNADSPTVPVTTANGLLHAPVVRLKHVSLGGMQVDNVDAVITELGDSPQLSGLLGMSFFQGMELSFKQDRLVISR